MSEVQTPAPEPDAEDASPTGDATAFGDPRAVCLKWDVPPEFEGTRADQYLATKVGRLSRARAARIVRRGDFRTPSGTLKPSSRVKQGPVELWRIPPDAPEDFGQEPTVLFEDDALLVIDKPPDLAVHPSARYLYRTLTAWLRRRAEQTDSAIAHPSHRLDRETSGVMVCAKTKAAQKATKGAFLSRTATKMYAAVVRGSLREALDIEAPLLLQGDRGLVRIKMIVDDEGQVARTLVRPLLHSGGGVERTLVACFPRTGRQHQIRAHLAHAGFPLVGDKLYAMGEEFFDAFTRGEVDVSSEGVDHFRHALHAFGLSLSLDDSERPCAFTAPFPEDLAALLSCSLDEISHALDQAWADGRPKNPEERR